MGREFTADEIRRLPKQPVSIARALAKRSSKLDGA